MAQTTKDKSVLLVDDDPDILTAIEAALSNMDVTIEKATDGNQAVAKIEQHKPDLVILDMMLPKKSGFLVMERIRARRAKQEGKPHVIMITGNQGQRHKLYAQSLGVDDYINKPFRMDRLLKSVEKLLTE